MRKFLLIVVVLAVAVPLGFGRLMGFINSSTITAEADEIAAQLAEDFRLDVPPGYKGAFGMQVSLFGIEGATVAALIPEAADPQSIFEGGSGIKFSPGEHTILLAIRSNARQSKATTYRDLQRFVMGDATSSQPVSKVFVEAGERRIAAYEHQSTVYGQDVLDYFMFLDDGGLVYLAGPVKGFDHGFKKTVAASLAAAYPANDLLYAHVEPPTRDADHPCGLGALPETVEVHAVGVRRGDRDLPGVAIDPTDDSAGEQSVAVGRTETPVVLVLMSGEPTMWKVLSTPEARIAGVLATGRGTQRVIGLDPGVSLRELDPNARNACRSFYAYEAQGRDFGDVQDRILEIFAERIARMHTQHGGDYFRIGELTSEPTLRGTLAVEDVVLDPAEHLLPGKLGLAQLEERGALARARPTDIEPWLPSLRATTGFDAERYRKRLSTSFQMDKVFIVKAATDLPGGMYGAHSAIFFVEAGVPDPGGDRGHNTLLFADGRCVGTSCP